MRTFALTILMTIIVLTTGHARAQRYDPAFPVCLAVVSFGATRLLQMQLHDDGPMQGIGQRPDLHPQPVLRWRACVREQAEQLSPSRTRRIRWDQIVRVTSAVNPLPGLAVLSVRAVLWSVPRLHARRERTVSRECETKPLEIP